MGFSNQELLLQNVDHFTIKEGSQRDQIVENYFGKDGMRVLVEELVRSLRGNPNQSLVDLGVGTGTFLIPILRDLSFSDIVCFDSTPKMLELLQMKLSDNPELISKIHLVIGDMQQISKSIQVNNKTRQLSIPIKFDRIMSTLAFHHISDTVKVLQGISEILHKNGKAVIVDGILSDTSGMNPSPEHAHDGFRLEELKALARKSFKSVKIKELQVMCNDPNCSSRGTGLFLMELTNPN